MQDKDIKKTSLIAAGNLRGLQNNLALDYYLSLLLLANRLSRISKFDMSIEQLKENILNEILSINSTLINLKKYDEIDIARLRYCVCVFIDESLLKNPLFIDSDYANNPLTLRLFNENEGGDKFFGIMYKWLENPSKNKDMLEFIYVCMILGYRGKFNVENDCNEKILYLCENICAAITPNIEMKEDIFNEYGKRFNNNDLFQSLIKFLTRHFKVIVIFIPLGIILGVFTFSTLKILNNNENIESKFINIYLKQ
ncbi:DotU family type IV/VI secretion system protein [Helicobacter saguini]|uniref:DotU family type IV/VI secretion system protein n=1 Tax=Helicobacter saguini TaxID=1548018 RepID=A0A347VNY1_9HELI|nr:type IVB secretion system protein IcmH/DotU [Helicobacter saguini]MWV61589.1 DotU family type IV/VI secretion system protein [Helicobacter saguini]MWV67740.1 DotU family type IV/VI secretion system protein [Helicobacter saguini]MWV70792.1 DotU family type IV/VI secretion system protein [Helicobacter saguini]MWV72696.1 DotU family type IV/VI secretion system protein [Helicobacter saguini]TLD94503.1 DotU family type IV/VI secretion system protein [Helicobacter saguini]